MKIKLTACVTVGWVLLWAGLALAGPRTVLVAPKYEFSGIDEGMHLEHEFVVKNTGDAPLNILGVFPP